MTVSPEVIADLVRRAARAPSAHNTQPWVPHIMPAAEGVSAIEVHLNVDPARTLPVGDPNSEDLHLAMGCWVESFSIAAAEVGLSVRITSLRGRGPDLEISLSVSDQTPTGAGSERAAGNIQEADSVRWPQFTSADLEHRQVDRGPMVRDEQAFKAALVIANRALTGTNAHLVEVSHPLWGQLLARASRYSYSHPAIFTETLEWLRFDPISPLYRADGLNAECLQIPRPLAALAGRLNSAPVRPWIARLTAGALSPLTLIDAVRGSRRRPTGTARNRQTRTRRRKPPPHHLVLVRTAPDVRHEASLAEAEVELGRILLRTWLLLDLHGLRVDVHSEIKDCPTTRAIICDQLLHDLPGAPAPVAAFTVGRSTTPVPRSHRLPN